MAKKEFNYLNLCPYMRIIADSLKISPYAEDRNVADYLDSKLRDLEKGTYYNSWNLADVYKPLTESEHRIATLRFFRGMTPSETARRLGLNEQHVRNVCSQIMQKYSIPQEEYWTAGGKLE